VIDPSEYAREVETYLCRKNQGHLIRVVGPAFELVRGWAATGVPLKIAFRGIDRCCERHDAKGRRRRPLRIEFCEADVLDAFDEWRRALGVTASTVGEAVPEKAPRKPALAAHIERVIARLAHARGTGAATTALHGRVDEIVRELEQVLAHAGRARGDARETIVSRLQALDELLMETAVADVPPDRIRALRQEATEELSAFGARMPPEARERALAAAFQRLVREASRLPTLRYE
jgi:hypothetical protein